MAIGTTISIAIHVLVGAVWVGTVTFVAAGVLPVARAGRLNADPLGAIAGRLRTITRASAVLLLLTGGHLAGTGYTVGTLTGSGKGHLVLTMFGLWIVATGLTEAGAGKLVDGADQDKVREPAHEATRLLQAAAVSGGLILLSAGLIVGLYYL